MAAKVIAPLPFAQKELSQRDSGERGGSSADLPDHSYLCHASSLARGLDGMKRAAQELTQPLTAKPDATTPAMAQASSLSERSPATPTAPTTWPVPYTTITPPAA